MMYEYRPNKNQEDISLRNVLIGLALGIVVCLLLMLCSSCTTTRYVPVIEYKTDTVRVNRTERDSIWVYCHDSIVTNGQGDTVIIDRWHWRDRWRERVVHDTTYISKIDSVPSPYPGAAEHQQTQQLTWWQQTRMHLGEAMLVVLAVLLIYGIRIKFR